MHSVPILSQLKRKIFCIENVCLYVCWGYLGIQI